MTYSKFAKLLGVSLSELMSSKVVCPKCDAPFVHHGYNGKIFGCPVDAPRWKPGMVYKIK